MSFLEATAKDIINRYGTDLSNITVVFPNKRASLFLNEYLLKNSSTNTIWSPNYITISDLFRSHSKLNVADHIQLVCELYNVYVEITEKKDESLDEFYGWGELLLADFDDLDKNMAKAHDVFRTTADHHELDSVDYLTEHQKKVLKEFFENFSDSHSSLLKLRFETLWNRLEQIYTQYRSVLKAKGIAYEGMLYRDVVESNSIIDSNGSDDSKKHYLFVGFNLLQKVEQQLFEQLMKSDAEVLFYWDYDKYYLSDKVNHAEAGKYIGEYMKHFPNALAEAPIYDNFEKAKSISFVSATTEDIQARYVNQWLTKERIDAGKRTAIVLCNEALLPTVVNSLPDEVQHVNITSGYPLANTPIATLVRQYFNLHLTGVSSKNNKLRLHVVNGILRNSYMKYISPLYLELLSHINENHLFFLTLDDLSSDENLRTFFAPLPKNDNKAMCDRLMWIVKTVAQAPKDCDKDIEETGKDKVNDKAADANKESNKAANATHDPLTQEALYRMYTLLNRLRTLVDEGGLNVDSLTFQRLLLQVVRTTTIPFHGEPIVGIQIMGVLETRNLDFDHLLVLSCNEGNLPKGVNDASFIPHIIRKAYGLTTVENKVAVYAYYFHRMLQRASDIEITYNSSTEDGQTGEMSRFMLQLLAESKLSISNKAFSSQITPQTPMTNEIEKNDSIMKRLQEMKKTSPSAIASYLRCPKQFFYKHVCGLSDNNDDDDEAVLDNRIFGLVFHSAMEYIYKPFINKAMSKSVIESIIKDPHKIDEAIVYALKIEMFKKTKEEVDKFTLPELNGNDTIMYNVVKKLILRTLNYDKSNAPMTIMGVEDPFRYDIEFNTEGFSHSITIKGIIDRLDSVATENGGIQVRVVDYKTGMSQPSINDIESIFLPEKIDKHSDYYLQTMLYSIIKSKQLNVAIAPALLYPGRITKEDYNPILRFGSGMKKFPIQNASEYETEFMESLKGLLSEIFNKNHPFSPTEYTDRCKRCAFLRLCH